MTKRATHPPRHAIHVSAPAIVLLLAAASALSDDGEHAPRSMDKIGNHSVRIEILYPCDEATVFDADDEINVEIAVSPSLALRHGNRIELLLDGRVVKGRDGEGFVLSELDDGPHRLRARLLDSGGNVVQHADPVRFYFWPESVQVPSH